MGTNTLNINLHGSVGPSPIPAYATGCLKTETGETVEVNDKKGINGNEGGNLQLSKALPKSATFLNALGC